MGNKYRPISAKKQKLIDAKIATPLQQGEHVWVDKKLVVEYSKTKEGTVACFVVSIDGDAIGVRLLDDSTDKKIKSVHISNIKRNTIKIGANPFNEIDDEVNYVAYTFDSIISNLNLFDEKHDSHNTFHVGDIEIKDCNWNPFVYDKDGNKQFYQRPLVWSVNDKQLLIESIYQGIDCGRVLVRKREWSELEKMVKMGERELFFNDIVDGKQRLNAVKSFILGEFTDLQGNYYADLSAYSQVKLTHHQLFSYCEMSGNTQDKTVIHQFLKLNFTGVPQSREHIDFVKSLQNKV